LVHNDAAVDDTGFFVVGVGSRGLRVADTGTSGLFNLVADFRVSSEAVLDGGCCRLMVCAASRNGHIVPYASAVQLDTCKI
jgi:hypothetical protein